MSIDSHYEVTVIFPAYNEAARIRETVSETVSYFAGRGIAAEVIVAADGDDGTREIVREMAGVGAGEVLRVIGAVLRRGKGRAVRDAVGIARGKIIGYADADNKVPIEEYGKIALKLAEGCPVVIGSRALARSEIERFQPLYRRLGGNGFRYVMQALTGLKVRDTQCGFKFFPAEVARELFRIQKVDGYMFDVEILVIARRLGYQIVEVPIRWRDDGDSRLDLVRGNLRNLRDIFRIRKLHRGLGGGSAS